MKISGSNFDDSDDSNVEDFWGNEHSDQLDEFNDDSYRFQHEDETLGKINAAFGRDQ